MYNETEIRLLAKCNLCPRNCNADRFSGKLGFCNSDAAFRVSSICIHQGEEPVISGKKGICNVFFPHCNLQCVYCQNHEISANKTIAANSMSFEAIVGKICETLQYTENIVGFVSPSHYIPQMLAIIRGVKETGLNPTFVYNTNGYDKAETLRMLEGIIDVYLPDFKYIDTQLSLKYSGAKDYPEVAAKALKEMYRQKGSSLIVNDNGLAESGMIIRHLVLPGFARQSIEVLKHIAEEISSKIHISLMSQYSPTLNVLNNLVLGRTITKEEYRKVKRAFDKFGFTKGWIQELSSCTTYIPDFSKEQPFE